MSYFWIFCAKYLFILVVIFCGFAFLRLSQKQKKDTIIFAVLSLPITYIFAKLSGLIYYDPRPFVSDGIIPLITHVPDNGFPSDHTLFVSALTMLFFWIDKKVFLTIGILSLFVAIGRVAVGVHHPLDIMAAIIISVLTATIIHFFILRYRKKI